MNSRERILAAFAHKQPDRCPNFIWINSNTMQRVVDYMGVASAEEALETLRVDKWRGVGLKVSRPDDYEEKIASLVPDQYKNNPELKITDNGRVVRVHEGSDYLEDTLWCPLQDVEDAAELERYPFPQEDWLTVPDDLESRIQELKDRACVVQSSITQSFKAAWLLRGMDNVLMDYLVRPDLIEALHDRIYVYNTAYASRLVKAGVDMVNIIGDLGMQKGMIMAPDVWRKFDKERLRVMFRTLKAINPDLKMYMHTDGDVRAIIPDLVEVGLDVLNPIQPECMDPVEIKRQYGDRLVLQGGVSLQRTLPFGSPQDVADEVKYLIENCNVDGGFVVGPSNDLFKEIPPENIVAMYEAVY